MRGEVSEMLLFSESCRVPSLGVSTFSFSRAHPVLMLVACIVAKKLLAIVNNPLLLSIMIKRFVLKHLILMADSVIKVWRHHWDMLSVLRLSTGPLSFFHFIVHCEIQKSLQWSVLPYLSDTHNVQCMMKIRIQYEMVQQKCLAEVQLCKVSIVALRILGRIVGNSTQCVVTVIKVWGSTRHWDNKWNYFLTSVLFC